MPIIRSQVSLLGASLLPDDRYVNTFHWDSGPASMESVAAGLQTALEFFYDGVDVAGGQLTAISTYLSEYVSSVATIKLYDLGDTEPRVPIESTFTLGPRSTSGLPEECAATLSFRGLLPNTPQRRGRIYLGPLGEPAILGSTTTSPVRLSTGIRSDATRALRYLATQTFTDIGCILVVHSPTYGTNTPVAFCHMDNAVDTQRRRGAAPSTRESLGPF